MLGNNTMSEEGKNERKKMEREGGFCTFISYTLSFILPEPLDTGFRESLNPECNRYNLRRSDEGGICFMAEATQPLDVFLIQSTNCSHMH